MRFVANSEKCRKYAFLGGPPRLLRYYMGGSLKFITLLQRGGAFPIYYNITRGGGVSPDPKYALRNIWTAPKGGGAVERNTLYTKVQNVLHHFQLVEVRLTFILKQKLNPYFGRSGVTCWLSKKYSTRKDGYWLFGGWGLPGPGSAGRWRVRGPRTWAALGTVARRAWSQPVPLSETSCHRPAFTSPSLRHGGVTWEGFASLDRSLNKQGRSCLLRSSKILLGRMIFIISQRHTCATMFCTYFIFRKC